MIWPPDIDFFLKNRDDVEAVLELSKLVRQRLPEVLAQRLRDAMRADYRRQSWRGVDEFSPKFENEELWWADPRFYNYKTWRGPFFYIGELNDATLIDATDQEEGVFLSIYFDPGDRLSSSVGHWRASTKDAVRHAEGKSALFGVDEHSAADDDNIIIRQSLWHVLNPPSLADLDEVIEHVVLASRAFTEVFAESLPSLPSSTRKIPRTPRKRPSSKR